jgi:uncharacterized protein YkwD
VPLSPTHDAWLALNRERAAAGAGPVARYTGMDAYAQDWAEQMAGRDVLEHSRFPYAAEIICSGADTAAEAIESWRSSQPHWVIAMNPAYTKVGVGFKDGYWVMVFNL